MHIGIDAKHVNGVVEMDFALKILVVIQKIGTLIPIGAVVMDITNV